MRFTTMVGIICVVTAIAVPKGAVAQSYTKTQDQFGPFYCVDLASTANATVYPLNVQIDKVNSELSNFVTPTDVRNGVPYILGSGDEVIVLNSLPSRKVNWALSQNGGVATADTYRSDATPDLAIDGSYHLEGLYFDNGTQGQLTVAFPQARTIDTITCISGNNPACTPINYTITALQDGQTNATTLDAATGSRTIAPNPSWDMSGFSKREQWGNEKTVTFDPISADWVRIDITDTLLGYTPNILEFEAWGTADAKAMPTSVTIPVNLAADEVYFVGNVGYNGYPVITDRVTVGNYVLVYDDSTTETIPLINGDNFASWQGVDLVPNAHPAFYYNYRDLDSTEIPRLLWYSCKPSYPGKVISSIRFVSTDNRFSPILAAVTVRKGGAPISINYTSAERVVDPDIKTDSGYECLDGDWKYMQDQGNLGESAGYFGQDYDDSSWQTMPVPSNWYLQGLDYFGIVWYRQGIGIPLGFSGKTIRLRFEGVHYNAKVWLNGQYLGEHVGYATPFEFDVTDAAVPGGTNVLAVKVDSPLDPGWLMFQYMVPGASTWQGPRGADVCRGGIWRPVYAIASDTATIDDIYATTTLSEDNSQATVNFQVTLNNHSQSTWFGILNLSFTGKNCLTSTYPLSQSVTLNPGKTVIDIQQVVENPKLWWTWDLGDPNLYLAQLQVSSGGVTSDAKNLTFGIRTVSIDGYTWQSGTATNPVLILNGIKVFLRGGSMEEEYFPSVLNKSIRRHDLTLMKDANLNFVRMMSHVDIPEMYDAADEMGILVYAEFTHGSFYSRFSHEIWSNTVLGKVFPEMVVLLRNHPSIFAWNCINEDGEGETQSRATCETIENYDSTRPISVGGYYPKYETHVFAGRMDRFILLQKTPFSYLGSVDCGFCTEADYIPSAFIDTAYLQTYFNGTNLFPNDGLDYFWQEYQYYHSPWLVRHYPGGLNALKKLSLAKLGDAILQYGGVRDDLMYKFHKLAFENIRVSKFVSAGAYTYYTMRSGYPRASQWNLINHDFTVKDQYQAIKEASRPILPILDFGLKDLLSIHVVNDTFTSGDSYTLTYDIQAGGTTLSSGSVQFDLASNSSQQVVTFDEPTGLYTLGKDMTATLQLMDPSGNLVVENDYELTSLDLASLYLNILPVPSDQPVNSCWFLASDYSSASGAQTVSFSAGYGGKAVNFTQGSSATYSAQIPADCNYCIKVAGIGDLDMQLSVDGELYGQAMLGDVALSRNMTTTETDWSDCCWYDLTSDGDHTKPIILRLTSGAHTFTLSFQESFQMNAWCLQRVPNGYFWGNQAVYDSPATYYVCPTGSDSDAGTSTDYPWQTIDKPDRDSLLQPGDTVILLDGTYDVSDVSNGGPILQNCNGSPSAPITYKAQSLLGAVVDRGQTTGNGESWALRLQHLACLVLDGIHFNGGNITCYLNRTDHIEVKNCQFSDKVAEWGPAAFWINDAAGNTLVHNNIFGPNLPTPGHGIVDDGTVGNNKFFNNVIIGAEGTGYRCTSGNQLPIGCEFRNNIVYDCNEARYCPNTNLACSNNMFFEIGNDLGYPNLGSGETMGVDPLLVDAASGDYQLKIGSPAIDAGIDVGLTYSGSAPDIGAVEYISDIISVSELSDIASLADGTEVALTTPVCVTVDSALFGDGSYYLENENRTFGIGVIGGTVSAGDRVTVQGMLTTASNGERILIYASILMQRTGQTLGSLGMTNKSLGGGAGAYQPSITGASGTNNVGLLVKVWGTVSSASSADNTFLLDDGSGVYVKVAMPSDLQVPSDGAFVCVTGISSCEKNNTDTTRLIKAISLS